MKLQVFISATRNGMLAIGSILICMLIFVSSVTASEQIQADRYVRVTKSPQFTPGGREFGELSFLTVRKHNAVFRLEVTWNPIADDDGYHTHNGVIDQGVIKINGNKGRYVSAEGDKELGQCIIDFTFEGAQVTLAQKGKCWWFGENVNASGVYRQSEGKESIIIK